VLASAVVTLMLAPSLALSAESVTVRATLSGPPVSGSPTGRGEATLTLNPETNEVELRLQYSNIASPTRVHIRQGPTGLEGNVVVPIIIQSDAGGTLTGHRQAAMPGIVARIARSPQEYYLVVINDDYPVGALRGQLNR
jgi:hypothetical protein